MVISIFIMTRELNYTMSSSNFPGEVSDYLNQILPNSVELIIKAHNLGFRFFTGFLQSNENSGLIDTIISHQRYLHMVIGIKTLMNYPFFKFVWQLKQDYSDLIIGNELSNILETFDTVYNHLVNYFPCVLINSKTNPMKVIFDDKYSVFVIDINTYRGFVTDKLAVLKQKYVALDRSECIADTQKVRFKIGNVSLTVKQYVLVKYLIEFYKLARIYETTTQ
jgi:hypothetical protein